MDTCSDDGSRLEVGEPLGPAIADVAGVMADDGFDEAFDGDHAIEYWFWNGTRLIPASPDEAERLREREAWERMEAWREAEQQRMRVARLRVLWARRSAPLHACRAAVARMLHPGRALGDEQGG